VVRVHITAAGRTELARRRLIRTERLGALFDQLPDDQQAALVAAVPAIGALTHMPESQANVREGAHL
jgi:hypothetical protein